MHYDKDAGPYRPFKYPPDYALARLHQKASMPGQQDLLQLSCPCCNQSIKRPYSSWWNRSIIKDFKQYGGGIVCYFWLMKLYIVAMILVLSMYGIYLQYLSWNYCQQLQDATLKGQVCDRLFGIWVVTNEDLYDLIQQAGDHDVIVRFSIIRAFVFILLLFTNTLSLYLVRWYKTRYPDKPDVSQFALLFKNVKDHSVQRLLSSLRAEFGYFDIKQAFIMRQLEPFYSAYQQQIETYYLCRNQQDLKKKEKLRKKLQKLHTICKENQAAVDKQVGRIIVVFNSLDIKERILQKYRISRIKKVLMLLQPPEYQGDRFYCQQCPKPDEIIWKNIGIDERKQFNFKIRSFTYYLGVLFLSVVLLYILSRILYFDNIPGLLRVVIQNILLIIVVVLAIGFRMIMDKLADMGFPYTYTKRTMSIVITTVMLHFIFYLWIPSTYLNLYHDVRGSVLNLISNQAITTVVVQIILTSLDLFYCFWNSKKKIIEDQDKPYACQKILHEKMQYPRFPFEFKLIVLYKFWSLITFFAFHIPMVLFLILIGVSFHYVKDKFNLYFHYRSQIISTRVQFNFLKIYTNLFTIYIYVVFVFTQRHTIQVVIGGILTVLTLLVQIFYFRSYKVIDPHEQENTIALLSEITDSQTIFYREKYQSVLENMSSQVLDTQISQYLQIHSSLLETRFSLSINDEDHNA